MKKYNKIFIAMVFVVGAVVGHGFPTLYQYIETLGGDYTSSPQRGEILNSDIQTGEPMKASTMNAKFNALNYELGDLESRIASIEGMSSISSGAAKKVACRDTSCYYILNGVADGQTIAKDYLVYVGTTAQIVSIVADTTESEYSSRFDGETAYPDVESRRIKAADIDELKFICMSDKCLTTFNGVADEQTAPKDYLVYITTTAQIVSRIADTTASEYSNRFDGETVYPDVESRRIKADQINILGE